MKKMFKSLIGILMLCTGIISCKKDDSGPSSGEVKAKDFIYNLATKNFTPDTALTAEVTSSGAVDIVYCYLVRSNTSDSLIFVGKPDPGESRDYTFHISASKIPFSSVKSVRGIKVMVRQGGNSSYQGLVKIDIYDPTKPFLSEFPVSISPDLGGGPTAITGKITSESGIAKVEILDDYQASGVFKPVQSITVSNEKEYNLNYLYTYRKAAQHIKIIATDIYGQAMEQVIDMPVDVNVFKPKFADFPESVTPDLTGGPTKVAGRITSFTGLSKIEIYDDFEGSFVSVKTIGDLNDSHDYTLNYDYQYRKRASKIKIVATDADNLTTELVIPLNVTYATEVYRDVMMSSQSATAPGSFFDASTGTVFGNCEVSGNENKLDFLLYTSTAGVLSFYSPTNTASAASSYKCNGVSWTPVTANLKATRFRVLLPTTAGNTASDNIYSAYNSGSINNLDDSFFGTISVPGSSSTKYDATATPASNIFNTTSAYLIWFRIPQANGSNKNCLVRVKEVNINATVGLSTVKFDIIVQK
ncbi:hypothetical protein [Arcticibacter sp. MXS-1]|uniref:hypothetical protein n=1 Tax=Arcticibacter sp. MXS-1 TaxID=3341726 RepID=UPI0035A8FDC2